MALSAMANTVIEVQLGSERLRGFSLYNKGGVGRYRAAKVYPLQLIQLDESTGYSVSTPTLVYPSIKELSHQFASFTPQLVESETSATHQDPIKLLYCLMAVGRKSAGAWTQWCARREGLHVLTKSELLTTNPTYGSEPRPEVSNLDLQSEFSASEGVVKEFSTANCAKGWWAQDDVYTCIFRQRRRAGETIWFRMICANALQTRVFYSPIRIPIKRSASPKLHLSQSEAKVEHWVILAIEAIPSLLPSKTLAPAGIAIFFTYYLLWIIYTHLFHPYDSTPSHSWPASLAGTVARPPRETRPTPPHRSRRSSNRRSRGYQHDLSANISQNGILQTQSWDWGRTTIFAQKMTRSMSAESVSRYEGYIDNILQLLCEKLDELEEVDLIEYVAKCAWYTVGNIVYSYDGEFGMLRNNTDYNGWIGSVNIMQWQPSQLGYLLLSGKTREGITLYDIVLTLNEFVWAGSDATGSVFGRVSNCSSWHIVCNKILWDLDSAPLIDGKTIYQEASRLPYLSACVLKPLHRHGIIRIGLPRYILTCGTQICGRCYPADTKSSCRAM
ncbi:uncharacterized protein BDR25DRAFT_356008 [Lindgomyces ingoldianus]|uniref:Uncharacterized protein n=1 Tax=Lindgomyces ingoldianus TaxID=673940 RepID=A0ACB6QTA3_9PLEO|nr:uncharacterized protein BDR25DRAFT_356008 [Lindgomyces ingoldianus]KAF2469750.1 hypothetical protein BDR25DRAFT_356008 [Lindgomyces ingoldianus]